MSSPLLQHELIIVVELALFVRVIFHGVLIIHWLEIAIRLRGTLTVGWDGLSLSLPSEYPG